MEEEIIEIPRQLCRICFNHGVYEVGTHGVILENDKWTLTTILKEFSTFEVKPTDNIPSMLCEDCTDQLKESFIFLRKLRKADEQLKQLLENTKQYANDKEDLVKTLEDDYYDTEGNEMVECDDENYLIEYLDDGDDDQIGRRIEKVNEDVKKKGVKRKINNSKTPHIVMTDNVSSIISKIHKSSQSTSTKMDLRRAQNQPFKIDEKSNEKDSFVVTKFILTSDEVIDTNEGDNSSTVNQICTFDVAPVEIEACPEIDLKEYNEESNTENPNTMYKCKYCPRAYSISEYLINHMRKNHVCQFCMQVFIKANDLFEHVREMHNSFPCILCPKEFTNNCNLRQHLRKIHNVSIPARVSLLSFKKKENT